MWSLGTEEDRARRRVVSNKPDLRDGSINTNHEAGREWPIQGRKVTWVRIRFGRPESGSGEREREREREMSFDWPFVLIWMSREGVDDFINFLMMNFESFEEMQKFCDWKTFAPWQTPKFDWHPKRHLTSFSNLFVCLAELQRTEKGYRFYLFGYIWSKTFKCFLISSIFHLSWCVCAFW